MKPGKILLISLSILVVGGIITTVIFLTEPTAVREGATKKTAMLVEVIRVDRGDFHPVIIATGTVEPEQDIVLSPRVSGEIIERAPVFSPGGFVNKGEVLLRIDPSDYHNALQLRKSELHQAEADLKIEMGRQDVAKKDFELFDESLREENRSLILREPQLNAVRARLEAAQAAVDQAGLDLDRTVIRAPFNAHVLSRNVNLGSQVSPGENLGRLVGVDEYWVVAAVPLSRINWMSFPDDTNETGSEVKIRNRTAWPDTVYRTGQLYRLIGALENQTRMARVLITVKDPLARKSSPAGMPPLIIGSFVEARIMGNEIRHVVRLSRSYVRKNETAWVMKDGKLDIRNLEIAFSDAEYAYITEGLKNGDLVVTSTLTTVAQGEPLRLQSDTLGNHAGNDTIQEPKKSN